MTEALIIECTSAKSLNVSSQPNSLLPLAEFMAETENQEELSFPIKRKSNLDSLENEDFQKKSQKIQTLDSNHVFADNEDGKRQEWKDMPKADDASQVPNDNSCTLSEVKNIKQDASFVDSEVNDIQERQNGNCGKEDNGLNGGREVDRKGKGIMLGDKGKGKMIVENDEDEHEQDSDDNSSDDGKSSNDSSDLSDDPLAEVDLENILPSRTRSRTFHPRICISNELANDAEEEDDDSDDSDDSEE